MKRTIAIMVGVVSVGVSTYLASHLWAQTAPYAPGTAPAAAPPAPACTSKIAVINLQKVIKNYKKFQNMQADMKKEADSYRVQIDGLQAKIKQLQSQAELPATTGEQREKIAKDIKDMQRQGQDKSEEYNALLQKHQFDHIVATYKDIQKACDVFARARGLEMVMHYQDGEGPEMYMPQFFGKRMSNGACQPVYMAPGMDITESVTEMLNRSLTSAAPPATGGAVR